MKSWIQQLAEEYVSKILSEESKSLEAVVKKHLETFKVSSEDLKTNIDKIASAIQEEHFPGMEIEKIKDELRKQAT